MYLVSFDPDRDEKLKEAFTQIVHAYSSHDIGFGEAILKRELSRDDDNIFKLIAPCSPEGTLSCENTILDKIIDGLSELFSDAGFMVSYDEVGLALMITDEQIENLKILSRTVAAGRKESDCNFLSASLN